MKLVDTVEEQSLLESLLEETKPALPPECAGLDYLLATAFSKACGVFPIAGGASIFAPTPIA
ncbi:hypothetical protein DFR48_110163 [Ciceribacter lividus]|uniref:Uncharacterized protein n=1 Tax=Ciceribacter lividus TaxID=1197950 RepID=A0A6I7HJS8_9HYPH|nr:hypothetical protein [Ciceribacter lividus]RCW21574.1 hypothetical protein DFR48_110163 [Ciceribacter lividus]